MSSIVCNECGIYKDCKYYNFIIHSCYVVSCADIQHEMSNADIEDMIACRDKLKGVHQKLDCSSSSFYDLVPDELEKMDLSLSNIIDMYNTDVKELLSIVDSEHKLIKENYDR